MSSNNLHSTERKAEAVSLGPIPFETAQVNDPESSAELGLMISDPSRLILDLVFNQLNVVTSCPLWNHLWVTFDGRAFASQLNSTLSPSSFVTFRGGPIITAGPATMTFDVMDTTPSRLRAWHVYSPMSDDWRLLIRNSCWNSWTFAVSSTGFLSCNRQWERGKMNRWVVINFWY